MSGPNRHTFALSALLALPLSFPATIVTCVTPAAAQTAASTTGNPLIAEGSWEDLRGDIIGDIDPKPGDAILSMTAPYRAHDAATVPIELKQGDPTTGMISSAKLVIDENPAPVAAEMTFGGAMHPLDMELRVRVNQYSNVRLIAETPGGPIMTGRFVKASGGCSAPATRDPQVALSTMGEIRAKHFTPRQASTSQRREAQIMIRHPNYSGLQRDQITQLFIAAHFVDHIEVRQGDDLLFTLDGGISLSENPVIRFAYTDNGTPDLTIRATDTEGNSWEKTLPKEPAT
ncbi:quinoprotein dehydrogenase-associated SoxYZ-like carrier [Roseibium sp.]|uniref:quinoprotein dehydrogenase-associated SoxYZ-like carrier n=1 Tax=Roseibium sp. TaxID=1936156 RepID=UPI003A974E42